MMTIATAHGSKDSNIVAWYMCVQHLITVTDHHLMKLDDVKK